jgi:Protein of unknown function (DUF2924)
MTERRPSPDPGNSALQTASVLAQLAALGTASTPDLKQRWRELFGTEPPPFSRPYLQSRLAYRIQELCHGGLSPETMERLEALGERLDGGKPQVRRIRQDGRPVAGTRLFREYQGVEHVVAVFANSFEYNGRPTARSPRSLVASPERAGMAGHFLA